MRYSRPSCWPARSSCHCQFFHCGLEVAVLVDVAYQHLGNRPLLLGQGGFPDLFQQDLLKRRAGHQRVKHELPLFLVLGGAPQRNIGLREMVPPFLVQLHQTLELGLKIIDRPGRFLGGGIKRQVGRGFGRVEPLSGLAIPRFLLLGFKLGGGGFLQHGILLQFLFHQRL
jgi:hypothetical protein